MRDEEAFTPVEERDLLVLAGDIGVALDALTFIRRELTRSPVLYVILDEYARRGLDDIGQGPGRRPTHQLQPESTNPWIRMRSARATTKPGIYCTGNETSKP